MPPSELQPLPAFLGANVPVITKAEFAGTGFTLAHLAGGQPPRLADALDAGGRGPAQRSRSASAFVYAYYDGIDKVAHEYGLGEFYDAELIAADRLVADLLEELPAGAALLVTADHGQVDVGDNVIGARTGGELPWWPSSRARAASAGCTPSPARRRALLDAATEAHGDQAWVVQRRAAPRRGLVRAGWSPRRRRAGSATWPLSPG